MHRTGGLLLLAMHGGYLVFFFSHKFGGVSESGFNFFYFAMSTSWGWRLPVFVSFACSLSLALGKSCFGKPLAEEPCVLETVLGSRYLHVST